MTFDSASVLSVGLAAVFASTRGYGKVAFFILTGVFLATSWDLWTTTEGQGTDGPEMLWGVNFLEFVVFVGLMFGLRKRTDAIF